MRIVIERDLSRFLRFNVIKSREKKINKWRLKIYRWTCDEILFRTNHYQPSMDVSMGCFFCLFHSILNTDESSIHIRAAIVVHIQFFSCSSARIFIPVIHPMIINHSILLYYQSDIGDLLQFSRIMRLIEWPIVIQSSNYLSLEITSPATTDKERERKPNGIGIWFDIRIGNVNGPNTATCAFGTRLCH